MSKQEKVSKLREAYKLPLIEEWTAEDEENLQRLKCSEIILEDTAFGRQQALQQQHFCATGVDMPANELNKIVELRKRSMRKIMRNNWGITHCY